jgi:hypothetical protein
VRVYKKTKKKRRLIESLYKSLLLSHVAHTAISMVDDYSCRTAYLRSDMSACCLLSNYILAFTWMGALFFDEHHNPKS